LKSWYVPVFSFLPALPLVAYLFIYLFAVLQGHKSSDRDMVVDLAKYADQQIRVKFQGGREGRLGLSLFKLL
jgi:hypothetical protein